MKSRCYWIQYVTAVLQVATGAVIVGVEVEIIHQEVPGTPGAFSLLHKEVAAKGLCQLIGGILMCIQRWRNSIATILLALTMSSMNCLTLAFLIWQCGYGISDLNEKCQLYPDSCQAGSSLAYSRSLLQTQESMFVIGTFTCLIAVIHLSQCIQNTIMELEHKVTARQEENYEDNIVFER